MRITQAPWTQTLLDEIARFPAAKHDDQIDCLSLIGRELTNFAPTATRPARPEPIECAMIGHPAGSISTRATLDEMFEDYENDQAKFDLERVRI